MEDGTRESRPWDGPLTCNRVRQGLPWLLNGSLGERAETRLYDHIASCAECEKELGSTSELWLDLSTARQELLSGPATSEGASDSQRWRSLRLIAAGLGAAAVALGIYIGLDGTNETSSSPEGATAELLETPGEAREGLLFASDFESGDLSMWSTEVASPMRPDDDLR